MQMTTPVCVTAAWYIFQGHLKQLKLFPFFCNESLIIFIFDPFPIIFHPNSHFPEALSLPMVIFLNGGSIQMAELVFPHDKQA